MRSVRKVFPQYWRRHLGHGIGLTTHEKPYIGLGEKGFFKSGMIFTYELPFYIRGLGGFNLEDVIIINEDGCESISTMERSIYLL